jgi:hypothetical protein
MKASLNKKAHWDEDMTQWVEIQSLMTLLDELTADAQSASKTVPLRNIGDDIMLKSRLLFHECSRRG